MLLEKAAKGRQILVNSQFEDQASVEKYTEEAREHYQDYNNALEACSKHSRTIGAVFLFLMAVPGLASGLFLLLFPNTAISLLSGFATPGFLQLSGSLIKIPALLAILCGILFAVAGSMLLARSRHFKKQLDTETRQLQEIFFKASAGPFYF